MGPRHLAWLPALPLLVVLGCAPAEGRSNADATREVPADPAANAPELQAAKTPTSPLRQKQFGQPITQETSTSLEALLKEPNRFATTTVRTEGIVSAVCQHMGCWMEIADASGKAHVKMAQHAFFVPREASGHRAVVQGKVIARESTECTEEAERQTGSVAKVEIEASGVAFLD